MPEAIVYSISHAGTPDAGDALNLAGDGIAIPSIIVNKGQPAIQTASLSQSVWTAYRAGLILISPDPDMLGVNGDVDSPIFGNSSVTESITDNYTVVEADCGMVKVVEAGSLTITLPHARDFVSKKVLGRNKFYVTFLVRELNVEFAAGTDVTIENPKLGADQFSAITAVLHTIGDGALQDTTWGLYGGLTTLPE